MRRGGASAVLPVASANVAGVQVQPLISAGSHVQRADGPRRHLLASRQQVSARGWAVAAKPCCASRRHLCGRHLQLGTREAVIMGLLGADHMQLGSAQPADFHSVAGKALAVGR